MKMIYKRIRDLREDNDMTQAQVGEKINVPQRTYAYYETGERMIPPHVLWALADLYDVSIATVYKGNIIKNLIMDCQSYTKYRPNETTGGIFVSWRRKEELPTGA